MLNVRIMLGYRLLKSNTHTLSCTPGDAVRARGRPLARHNTRESSLRTLGATMRRLCSSARYRKSNDAMLAATRSGVMPVSLLRATDERDEIQLLDDLEREPRIGARVQRKPRQIVLVTLQDFADAIVHIAFERFAFAEHFARNGVERVVVEAHERAAHQVDAVEHEPPRNARAAAAEVTARRAHRAVRPASRPSSNGCRTRCAIRASTDRSKSTTFQPVSTSGSSSITRLQNASIAARSSAHAIAFSGIGRAGRIDDEHFVGAAAVQRDGEQLRRLRVRFDVERQH